MDLETVSDDLFRARETQNAADAFCESVARLASRLATDSDHVFTAHVGQALLSFRKVERSALELELAAVQVRDQITESRRLLLSSYCDRNGIPLDEADFSDAEETARLIEQIEAELIARATATATARKVA